MSELAKWDSFYVIVGSAAGTLTGLQFVVITLFAQRPGPAAYRQDRFRICHADYRSLGYRAAPVSGSRGSMAVDHSGCRYFGPALGASVKANRTGLARLT